jgi:hypothetical protein
MLSKEEDIGKTKTMRKRRQQNGYEDDVMKKQEGALP